MRLGYEKAFNDQIKYIIELMEHEFYVVHRDIKIKCTCLQEGTGQANPSCKKCLGTGYKIKIGKEKGATQMTDLPPTSHRGAGIITNFDYYIKQPTKVKRGDYIVELDDNRVLLVNETQRLNSFKAEKVFFKANCVIKKTDHDLFLKNFKEIIGGIKK